MFQLIYTSVPTSTLTQTDAENIAMRANIKNRVTGVTGILLMSHATILQVLEGEESAVRGVYQLTKKSRRHTDCDVLLTRHCDARSFPKWSMGYRSVENDADLKQTIAVLRADRDARMTAQKIAS